MTEYRPVRLSPELFDALAFRADDGRALTFQWGEPDADGFYVPTITVTEDAWFLETSRLRERNAALEAALQAISDHMPQHHEGTVCLVQDEARALLAEPAT